MSQSNIRWKGRPHRHLPRIRVASPHYGTVIGRHYAQLAALNVSQLPYSLDLQKARLQQNIRIRGKKQNIRRSLGGIMASSRTSRFTMPDTRLSRLESPKEYITSREGNNRELEVPLFADQLSESPFHLSLDLLPLAETVSNLSLLPGGRDVSISSMPAADRTDAANLKNLAESKKQRDTAGGPVGGQHGSNMSAGVARKANIFSHLPVLGRSRTYEPRLPVRRARHRNKPTSSKRKTVSQPQSIRINLKPAATNKEPTSTCLSIQEATSGSVSSTSTKSSLQPVRLSDLPFRTPSQLLALKKFSRGLERHLLAQEAVRKACLSSSLSTSTFSADTIVEFVPYIAEFQAAGLAVTSTEQRRTAIEQPRREVLTPVSKEIGNKEQTPPNVTKGMNSGSPIASHDGSGGCPYTDTSSSCTTAIAFSNCREPNSSAAYPTRNISIKKAILPWLSKAQEPSSLRQPLPQNDLTANIRVRSSSGSTCETCATTILDFSSWPMESERKQTESDSSCVGLRPVDVRGIHTNNDSIKGKNREVLRPIVPRRPVRVALWPQNDGNNSSKASGNKTCPLEVNSKTDRQTRTTLANFDCIEKNVSIVRDNPKSQYNNLATPMDLIPTSGTSIGSFRTSPKLLAQQKSHCTEEPKSANDLNKAVASSQIESAHSPSRPPSQNDLSNSKSTHQLPDLSIQDQYGFETPSIFELALQDVATGSQSLQEQFEEKEEVVTNLHTSSSRYRINDDPVKRKSAPYRPLKLSLRISHAATASSLGLASTSETQTTSSTDYSDIRDKDVFKGLQIALAAACNKDLDLWIMKMSGCRVRKFLADLRAFEGLGVNTVAEQAKRTAKKRMEGRDQKMRSRYYSYVQDHELGAVQGRPEDMKEKRRAVRADDSGRRGLLIAQMSGKKDLRAGECTRERAQAMGWGVRSVSAGY